MELIISLVMLICLIVFGALSGYKFARQKWNNYLNKKITEILNANRSNGKHH